MCAKWFLNITIEDKNGNAKDIHGNTFSVADRDYFQKAIKGNKVVSEVVISRANKQSCVVYAVPIYKDGEIEGVLHSAIALDDMSKHFSINSIFVEGTVFVVDRSGQLIIGDKDIYDKEDFFGNMNKNALSKNRGHFYHEIDGKNREVYYEYEKASDWFIFTLVNQNIIQEKTSQTNQLAFILVIRIAVILIFFIYLWMSWDRKKNKEIKKRMEEMNTILKNAPGGVLCYSVDHGKLTLQFVSDGACELFGLSEEEAKETLLHGYVEFVHPEDLRDDMTLRNEAILPEIYYRIIAKDGRVKWVIDRRHFIEDNGIRYAYISIQDISNMMRMQEELEVSDAKQRMILEGTNLMYFDYELDKKEIHFSKGWMEYSGCPEVMSITSENALMLEHFGNVNLSKKELIDYVNENGYNFQIDEKIKLLNGEERWVRIKGTIILDQMSEPTHIIAVMEDIDEMKRVHEELEVKTMIDGLTGIYNKESAERFIKQKLMDTTLLTQQVLFIIDVDDFKDINDTYGHLEGDEVLSQIGEKLQRCFRKDDIVGRIGGDEFIALMSDVLLSEQAVIEEKAKQIVRAVDEITGLSKEVSVTCSVGIAIYPNDASSYDELFQKADKAMYHIKTSGKSSYHFYKEEE